MRSPQRSQSTIDTIRDRMGELTDEDHRQAALSEARRRLAGARHVIAEGAETLGETAEERWAEARKATAPTVKAWRKRASEVAGDFDADALVRDARQLSTDVGHRLKEIGADLGDVTRHEADRIIASIHEAAEQARKDAEQVQREARDAERSRRNRAILGWALIGTVVGMVVSARMRRSEPTPTPAPVRAPAPVQTEEQIDLTTASEDPAETTDRVGADDQATPPVV